MSIHEGGRVGDIDRCIIRMNSAAEATPPPTMFLNACFDFVMFSEANHLYPRVNSIGSNHVATGKIRRLDWFNYSTVKLYSLWYKTISGWLTFSRFDPQQFSVLTFSSFFAAARFKINSVSSVAIFNQSRDVTEYIYLFRMPNWISSN